jgi:hypothetical protein
MDEYVETLPPLGHEEDCILSCSPMTASASQQRCPINESTLDDASLAAHIVLQVEKSSLTFVWGRIPYSTLIVA